MRLLHILPAMEHVDYIRLTKSPDLQRFFHLVWRLFHVNVALVAPSGKEGWQIGSSKMVAPFCAALHKTSGFQKRCAECDQRHLTLAARQGAVLRYRCHLGLTEFIIPIITEEGVVAYLQSGQVLENKPRPTDWTKLKEALPAPAVNVSHLRSLYFRLRIIPPPQQQDLIDLLELFATFIARAQKKFSLLHASWNVQIAGRAQIFIGSHLMEPLTLPAIAQAACTSPRNLVRVFRKETGESVWDYIHAQRIANACRQLTSTTKSCTEIAQECGFGSVQHFNRIFLRLKKSSPSAWRKRNG